MKELSAILRVVANIFYKQSRIADKVFSYSLVLGEWLTTPPC